jgi:uncharacterized OsmC-like protein
MADDTESSVTTYGLTGTRESRHGMRVDTGEATFDVDMDLNPIQYLLGSLLGCLNSTATTVARERDIDVEGLEATVEGDIDYSRYKGEQTDARAGLQDVRVTLTVDADADDETLAAFGAAVEERCPVSETLANGTDVGVTVRED